MHSGMDSFLVTLLVIAIAGLSNWLQQRAKSREMPPPHPGPPAHPVSPRATLPHPTAPQPRPVLPSQLERELRRLLGEELVLAPTPAPPVVPPRVHPAPLTPAVSRHSPTTVPVPVPEIKISGSPGPLQQSAAAYLRAQQLRELTDDRIRKADPVIEGPHPKAGTQVTLGSEARTNALNSLRSLRTDRQAVRQAFIAALVFGSPKALD